MNDYRSRYDRVTAESPVSSATVTHGDDGPWTVAVGTTIVAQCTSQDEAEQLADRLNAAKTTGDTFDRTHPYNTAGTARLSLLPHRHEQPVARETAAR